MSRVCFHVVIPLLILVVCVSVWYGVGRLPTNWFPAASNEGFTKAGTFGDSFGYVNSLFSALALAGVVYAVILQTVQFRIQQREILENRQSLNETRETQQRQAQSLAGQADALLLAAYLSTLNTFHRMLSQEIDASPPGSPERHRIETQLRGVRRDLNTVIMSLGPRVGTILGIGNPNATGTTQT